MLGALLNEALRSSFGSGIKSLPTHQPLLTLQKGKPGAIPLFFVPGAGTGAIGLSELAGCLDKDLPIHGFQPRGLDGLQLPHTTVAAHATCYLKALAQVHPRGPVHLLGHSYGGWVVLDMAFRLQVAGRSVASLTILDSGAPAKAPRPVNEQLEIVQAALSQEGLMPPKAKPSLLKGPLSAFSAALRSAYQPTATYKGLLRLALMDDPRLDPQANEEARENAVSGWRRVAPKLQVLHAPGNHMTALKLPHAQEIAQWMMAPI